METVDVREVQSIIQTSLEMLTKFDKYILQSRLKEECINHKFAIYLENVLKQKKIKYHHVDMEYNKNHNDPKFIEFEEGQRAIRPNIIVHKRGSNYYNFIAIEAKKGYKSKYDEHKIKELLREPYSFRFGCLISYLLGRSSMKYSIYYLDCNYEIVKIEGKVSKI